MAAIITTPFRVLNAENFKEDVADSGTSVYIGIGKSDAWSNTTSDLTDTTPFVPGDHIDDINEAHQQMIGMKLVGASDVSHVVPRYNYADGQSYVGWDSSDSDIYDKRFYVITSEFKVYKCLEAGSSTTSVQPVHTSRDPVTGADDYKWKYMYTVTTADSEKFLTNSYMPVKTLTYNIDSNGDAQTTLASTNVDRPQQNSQVNSYNSPTAAGIERIVLTDGGTFASGSSAPTITITGDGSGATATATMNSAGTAVESITITAEGTNYTVADITFSSGDASARAVITPPNGHGVDPVKELGAFFTAVNVQLDGSETGDLTVGNDFRQVTIIKNPLNSSDDAIATATTRKTLPYLKIVSGGSISNFAVDQVITGQTSGAKAYLTEIDTTQSDNVRFYYYQNEKTGYDSFDQNEEIRGSNPTGGQVNLKDAADFDNVGEIKKGSGQVIFLENRAPINRTASQIEDIKCIIEF